MWLLFSYIHGFDYAPGYVYDDEYDYDPEAYRAIAVELRDFVGHYWYFLNDWYSVCHTDGVSSVDVFVGYVNDAVCAIYGVTFLIYGVPVIDIDAVVDKFRAYCY